MISSPAQSAGSSLNRSPLVVRIFFLFFDWLIRRLDCWLADCGELWPKQVQHLTRNAARVSCDEIRLSLPADRDKVAYRCRFAIGKTARNAALFNPLRFRRWFDWKTPRCQWDTENRSPPKRCWDLALEDVRSPTDYSPCGLLEIVSKSNWH